MTREEQLADNVSFHKKGDVIVGSNEDISRLYIRHIKCYSAVERVLPYSFHRLPIYYPVVPTRIQNHHGKYKE